MIQLSQSDATSREENTKSGKRLGMICPKRGTLIKLAKYFCLKALLSPISPETSLLILLLLILWGVLFLFFKSSPGVSLLSVNDIKNMCI